jgi:hypothetical protein
MKFSRGLGAATKFSLVLTQLLSKATFFRLSRQRLTGSFSPVRVLLVVAFLEVVINRVMIGSRTEPGLAAGWIEPGVDPPSWYTALSYLGLFAFYFSGTLAAIMVAARCFAHLRQLRDWRDALAHLVLAVAAVIAAVPLLVAATPVFSAPLEVAFAAAVLTLVASGIHRDHDVGAQLGLVVVSVPLAVHTLNALGARYLWPEGVFDTPGIAVARAGVVSLCVAALLSPYLFAPRPFARAVTRPFPVILAMGIAGAGAVVARTWYPTVAKAATLAIGVEVNRGQADPRLALYLLSIATLTWTLAACALAASEARRTIGAGIALILLGGYAFRWPSHYLLPLLGLALVADATRRVREQELSALPISIDTPPIADTAWAAYVGAVTTTLKRSFDGVHSLTTRAEGGLTSTQLVGDNRGLPVRTRIERIDGSVVALDVVIGREIDEVRGATLSLWAIPPRQLGVNPAGPPAAPLFKSGDGSFDERFKARGSSIAFGRLFDEGLRARTVATLDGWLAYWEGEGLRYRVYPGRGAPLDHPIPLSDLALGKPGNPERLVAVIELLVEIGARGVAVRAEEPALLEEEPA